MPKCSNFFPRLIFDLPRMPSTLLNSNFLRSTNYLLSPPAFRVSPPEPTCCPTLSPAHFRVAQIFFDSSYNNSLRSTNSVLSPPAFRVSPPEPTTYARINFVAGPLKRVSPAHFLFAQIFVDSSYDNSLRYTNYLLSPPAFRLSPPPTELTLG